MIDQDRIAELNQPLVADHDRDLAELVARIGRGGRTNPEAVVGALAEPRWRPRRGRSVPGERGSAASRSAGSPHDGGEDRRRRGARALMGITRSISPMCPGTTRPIPKGCASTRPGRASGSTP